MQRDRDCWTSFAARRGRFVSTCVDGRLSGPIDLPSHAINLRLALKYPSITLINTYGCNQVVVITTLASGLGIDWAKGGNQNARNFFHGDSRNS